jgi:hypothetical protein
MRGDKNPMRRPEVRAKVSAATRGIPRPWSIRPREENANWKGGRSLHAEGYVRIRVGGQYLLEHRLVMEDHLGRKLRKSEIVHHINGDPEDNRIENLKLMTQAEHVALHNREGSKP